MKNIILVLLLFVSTTLSAQEEKSDDKKLSNIEVLPSFPGGYKAFGKYISSSLNYPEVARIIGVDGKVVISFVVEKNGEIVEAEPKSCLGAGCEAEAKRILEQSPRWTPGVQDGKVVRVMYTLPITFNNPKLKFTLKELNRSTYNYVFLLRGEEYSLSECEELKLDNFKSEWVETSFPHPDQDKFANSGKVETYVLKIKDSFYDDFLRKN